MSQPIQWLKFQRTRFERVTVGSLYPKPHS